MNVLGLFSVTRWLDIGSISLHFDHNRVTSPLLLVNTSLALMSIITSCL